MHVLWKEADVDGTHIWGLLDFVLPVVLSLLHSAKGGQVITLGEGVQ